MMVAAIPPQREFKNKGLSLEIKTPKSTLALLNRYCIPTTKPLKQKKYVNQWTMNILAIHWSWH